MRQVAIIFLIALAIAGCKAKEKVAPPEGETEKPALEIKNMHEWPLPEGLVLVASQPSAAAFPAIKANGFKTVINLRAPEEMVFDEEGLAKEHGLVYANIPIRPAEVTREQARNFTSYLTIPEAYPILVHCSSGNRAAMMMAIAEVFLHGTDRDAAIAKARERGLTKIDLEKTVQALTAN